MLGTAHVDKSEDHKTIYVGSEAGQFHSIQLRVSGPVESQRVIVHFGDGSKEELADAERVRSGGKARGLNLPGERRTIDSVELRYSKENLDTRPEVALTARDRRISDVGRGAVPSAAPPRFLLIHFDA
jgi:hypothetical protein